MPALAIEAEGGDAGAAPFTRARSALCAEKPHRRPSDRRPLDLRPASSPGHANRALRRALRRSRES